MHIGILSITLHIPGSQSLKNKRKVIKSLCDRLKNKFNASVSETANQDKWQLATIGLVFVNADLKQANSMLNKIMDFIMENTTHCELTKHTQEIISMRYE